MVPTLLLVGADQLPMVPEFLNLGVVVVIAPDRETLASWQEETLEPGRGPREVEGTVLDMEARRILHEGASLPLSDLEFRVLGALMDPPGRALSFRDLRRVGWGDAPELPVDPYSVKALVQRLRAKLDTARTAVVIESVRGYGFRLAPREGSAGDLARMG
jgi:DNA-binding response OmpR family regulator